jgi:hypothetical protein
MCVGAEQDTIDGGLCDSDADRLLAVVQQTLEDASTPAQHAIHPSPTGEAKRADRHDLLA